MRALVVLLVACGGARAPKAVGNRAAPPPKPDCEAFVWNRPGTILRCTPGLFPTAGFYVELAGDISGIVALDGSDLIPFDTYRQPSSSSVHDCSTVDLDGDGVDEIVETMHQDSNDPMIGSATWLEIRRLAPGTLATVRGPYTSVERREVGACRGEVRLAGRTIVITVETTKGLPPSDCLAPGTHTFALTPTAIVETR